MPVLKSSKDEFLAHDNKMSFVCSYFSQIEISRVKVSKIGVILLLVKKLWKENSGVIKITEQLINCWKETKSQILIPLLFKLD